MVRVNSFFSSAFARNSLDKLFAPLPSNSATRNVERLARHVSRDIPKSGGFESLDLRTSGAYLDAIARIEKSMSVIKSTLGYSASASEKVSYVSGLTVARAETHDKTLEEGLTSRFFLDVGGTELTDQLKIVSTGPRHVGIEANGGDDTISVIGKSARNVNGGQGRDVVDLFVEKAQGVNGGQGADRVTVIGKSASAISGGGGSDTLNIMAETVSRVYGDRDDGARSDPIASAIDALNGQNDRINVAAKTASAIYAGPGNDTLNVMASDQLQDVDGGDGNDMISVVSADARKVSGGAGDDLMMITAANAEGIRGGRGNDTVTLLGTDEASVHFARGDGRDLINISGATTIVLEDGLSFENATITRESNAIKIVFADSEDAISIFHGYADFDEEAPKLAIVSDSMLRIA